MGLKMVHVSEKWKDKKLKMNYKIIFNIYHWIFSNSIWLCFIKWSELCLINGIKNGTTNRYDKRWKVENESQNYFEYIVLKCNVMN